MITFTRNNRTINFWENHQHVVTLSPTVFSTCFVVGRVDDLFIQLLYPFKLRMVRDMKITLAAAGFDTHKIIHIIFQCASHTLAQMPYNRLDIVTLHKELTRER